MERMAWLFPGQGSQYVGMGRQAVEADPRAREVLDTADEVLGFKLSSLCLSGPAETLTDTINAQPAILAVSMAYLRLYEQAEGAASPAFVAGHSLGEYTALVAAGALSLADGLLLVRERGRLMKEAGERYPGRMAALIGLDVPTVEALCREATGSAAMDVVQIANYNAPGQIVISGAADAVERAMALAKERGARRAIPLAVSIASHSPLMREAAEGLRKAVNAVRIEAVRTPVVSNVTARPLGTPEEIREELVQQLISPVRWIASVEYMVQQGVRTFIEIGPKDVLVGLHKRIAPDTTAINWESQNGYAPGASA